MIIIADSGSTKTVWSIAESDIGIVKTVQTSGINPMYQDSASILHLLQAEFTEKIEKPADIFFYGAGCINNDVNETVRSALTLFFNCSSLSVQTDLMAAARALCQDKPGIACILGTGSNSCYYDGHDIVKNVSPLGYMLGDEGSGAVIGRKFVSDLLKNQLPQSVSNEFYQTYNLKPFDIMDKVYKKPFPNRFLAQFTRFIHEHPEEASLQAIVTTSFGEFFKRNVRQYLQAFEMPINFTGSVAYYFQSHLREAAASEGLTIGRVTQSPSDDLIRFHFQHKL